MEIKTNKRTWYALNNQSDTEVDVYIYDEIGGWGITAKNFIEEMSFIPSGKTINLRINSPGGSVFDAVAMFNFLARRKDRKVVYVDGMAASSASVLAMVGDEIVMPANAMMFLHNPWSIAVGNSDQLEKEADALSKIQAAIVSIYANRTGQSIERVQQLMDDETWMSAAEAVELGFADRADEARQVAAKFDATLYNHIPSDVASRFGMKEEKKMENEDKPVVVVEAKPDAASVPAPVAVDPRAEFKQFVDRFGADRAAKFYAEGVSFADAERVYVGEIEAENIELKKKIEDQRTKPAAFDKTITPAKTLWQQYREIKDAKEKTRFYRANKAAMDAQKE